MKFDDLSISAKLMFTQAQEMGIEVQMYDDPLLLKMTYNGFTWLTKGSRSSVLSSVGTSIANNKYITKLMLLEAQAPTAKYFLIKGAEYDEGVIETFKFPIVMKPLDGNRGENVLVGLRTIEEIDITIKKYDVRDWIVEELLVGGDYRVTCVGHKFVAAAERIPAFVVGDGDSSVKELINSKNRNPYRGKGHTNYLTNIEIDEDLINVLLKQNLNLDSVPNKDETITLRQVCNLSRGGEVKNVTSEVCPENIQLFETISRVCDLNIIGIDVMCQSLAKPLDNQPNAGIIEINASPGLMIHHTPYNPENSVNVAQKILEMTIAKLGGNYQYED